MIVQTYGKYITYNLVITIQINIVVAVDNFFQIFMDFILSFFFYTFLVLFVIGWLFFVESWNGKTL